MYQPIDHGHVCYYCVGSTVAGGEKVKRNTAICVLCGHRSEGRLMKWEDRGPLMRGANFAIYQNQQANAS